MGKWGRFKGSVEFTPIARPQIVRGDALDGLIDAEAIAEIGEGHADLATGLPQPEHDVLDRRLLSLIVPPEIRRLVTQARRSFLETR